MTELESESTAAGDALRVEDLIETYKTIAEWIRFADTKAAATLTVNGVLLGLLVPTLKTFLAEKHAAAWLTPVAVGLFAGWLVLLVASAVSAFLCILPLRGTHRLLALAHATHFHPAAIASKFPLDDPDAFTRDCDRSGPTGFRYEVMTAMLIDSHLSSKKYGFVTRAIWCLQGASRWGSCTCSRSRFSGPRAGAADDLTSGTRRAAPRRAHATPVGRHCTASGS